MVIGLNFFVLNCLPGGPLEKIIASAKGRFEQKSGEKSRPDQRFHDEEMVEKLKKEYGLDQPFFKRLHSMLYRCFTFDFGQSYFKAQKVSQLLKERLPISLTLGVLSVFFTYLLGIPLGIAQALRQNARFEVVTTFFLTLLCALPSFLIGILLMIFFASGTFFSFFPLKGFCSEHFATLGFFAKITDILWHLTLPLTAEVAAALPSIAFFIKNSFLEELKKPYILSARAQGFSMQDIIYRHASRNALLMVFARLPLTLMTAIFAGSVLIENLFSLQGLGQLSIEALLNQDYPIILAALYLYTLLGLFLHLISDLWVVFLDRRITFDAERTG